MSSGAMVGRSWAEDMDVPTVQVGDEVTAFEEMAATETPRLFALAMTITADAADSQDVVQETLTSAWTARSQLRDPDKHASWLTRICVNHAIRSLRKQRLLRAAPWRQDHPPRLIGAEDRLTDLLDLDRAFRHLSAHQRAVFALHVHYGYTVEQCGDFLGCRPGTARSHLARAVAQLRKELSR